MNKFVKKRILTDALTLSYHVCAAGFLSYIEDVWNWEYNEKEMTFLVNASFYPDMLERLDTHHYPNYEFLDGWQKGELECRLIKFELSKPIPAMDIF